MKNSLLILLTSLISLVSCNKENTTDKGLARLIFNSGNLKFISTSLNPKKETMSALYGNEKAMESLSEEGHTPKAGAIMKLVTWRYHDNPQYIGGTITGELVSIETVQTDGKGKVSYQIQNTTSQKSAFNKEERISYFMSYHPVMRP
ncbi:hypothetical protein [Chryseobacterium sp.]|uniref:hypothetical protein n=1 Tax=Chryseobacterium sp. TaxID=1871047 RepID=UPI0025C1044D|nr:hypothetical protein [Chryseobacterium sp.]MBV8328465.1 hypothetical protein [Chryseobacterium sp.]